MIPSFKWFPSRLQERAAWFQNFVTNLTPISGLLGITPAEMTSLTQDNQDFQSIAATTLSVETFAAAVRQFRISVTEGNVGDPQPVFPSESFAAPVNDVPAGIFQRLIELVDRIRTAPGYTDEMGAALGIIPQPSGPLNPEDVKPAIKASDSFSMYKFTVNVTRMGMPQFKVQLQRDGSTTWQDVAFGTSNPIEVTVTPTTPGQPERVLVRAVLLQKNEPIGQPSDPTFVTVNP